MTLEVALAHPFPGFTLDLSFTVEASGVTALFGPSGSGKTTTINAVAGLFRPAKGRIAMNSEVLLDTAQRVFVPPRRRRMGYVFQDARLFPHLTARENLLYGWQRSAKRAETREIDHVIELLGLSRVLARRPRTLSGGEKQRVALGRALLSGPRLLLLDEPLAALDTAMKEEIMPYLERLRDEANIPMLFVSHSAQEVARLADHLTMLEHGHITAQGAVFDLFSRLSPETRELSSGAVVEARVMRHHLEDQLSELALNGASLLVPKINAAPGAAVRLRIYAKDVTIALDTPARISANNVLPVTIGEIADIGRGEVDVQLICGETKLIAQITQYSLRRLELRRGMAAYAIIKSVTVDRRRLNDQA